MSLAMGVKTAAPPLHWAALVPRLGTPEVIHNVNIIKTYTEALEKSNVPELRTPVEPCQLIAAADEKISKRAWVSICLVTWRNIEEHSHVTTHAGNTFRSRR